MWLQLSYGAVDWETKEEMNDVWFVNVIYLYSPLQQSISVYQSALQQIINKENMICDVHSFVMKSQLISGLRFL